LFYGYKFVIAAVVSSGSIMQKFFFDGLLACFDGDFRAACSF
jgi:hypothetical protein